MEQLITKSSESSGFAINRYFSGSLLGTTSSWENALQASFEVAGLTKGDQICMPTLCMSDTLSFVLNYGLIPIFIESERQTWNLNPEFLVSALAGSAADQKPKAILVCHLFGMPADIRQIKEVANQYSLPIIEDASQALGSYIDINQCGTIGNFGLIKIPLVDSKSYCFALITQNPNKTFKQLPDLHGASAFQVDTGKHLVLQIQSSRSRHALLKSALVQNPLLEILDETEANFSNKEIFAALLPKKLTFEEFEKEHSNASHLLIRFPKPGHLCYPEMKYFGDHYSLEVFSRGFYVQLSKLKVRDIETLIRSFTDQTFDKLSLS
jgi:hypothetical protein